MIQNHWLLALTGSEILRESVGRDLSYLTEDEVHSLREAARVLSSVCTDQAHACTKELQCREQQAEKEVTNKP